jgi:hypothetical protein
MKRTQQSCVALLAVLFMTTSIAHAQWSSSPATNLIVANRSGEQAQPKIVATPDGGFYISWFDNSAGGYDVYLQRLDVNGNELWAHNGVLVADRGYSSTQDYGLSIDTVGNALLAFRVFRTVPDPHDSIVVSKVSPDGTLLWGPDGIEVSGVGAVTYSPKIAGTSDGNVVVAWKNEGDVAVQKLDPDGTPLWGVGVTLSHPTDPISLSDLQPSDAGTVIASFTAGFFPGPFHLWAQKLASADGALVWGPGHVQVYDLVGGSLQIGNFPRFVTDGAGGAVFSWYTSTPTLQCRAQRILADGSEAFAHNGVQVSTHPSQIRVSPSAAFLAATQEIVVAWTEQNFAQSQSGLYAQKLDNLGVRQWTDNGRQLMPLSSDQVMFVNTLPFADGAIVTWIHSVSFNNDPVYSIRVDGNGDFAWSPPITEVGILPTGSSRLVGALSTAGYAAYAWADDGDILAQNVNGDGSLGPSAIFADGFETGDTTEWSTNVP